MIVFKYPGNAKQNYIKRCVGLEKEIIKIHHGDIYVQKANDDGSPAEEEFQIARKPPRKLVHMLQLVHDSRYLSSSLQEVGWPLNWQPGSGAEGWTSPDNGRTYVCPATRRNGLAALPPVLPGSRDLGSHGENVESKVSPLEGLRQLEVPVTDFYAYNAQTRRLDARGLIFQQPDPIGMHWVGDLAVEADIEVEGDSGQLDLVLVEAGRLHACQIDLAIPGGQPCKSTEVACPLANPNDRGQITTVTAETPIRGAGRYRTAVCQCRQSVAAVGQ